VLARGKKSAGGKKMKIYYGSVIIECYRNKISPQSPSMFNIVGITVLLR